MNNLDGTLLYYYVSLVEYPMLSEPEKTGGVRQSIVGWGASDVGGRYIVDLDGDGKYESIFAGSIFDHDERKALREILAIKIAAR